MPSDGEDPINCLAVASAPSAARHEGCFMFGSEPERMKFDLYS